MMDQGFYLPMDMGFLGLESSIFPITSSSLSRLLFTYKNSEEHLGKVKKFWEKQILRLASTFLKVAALVIKYVNSSLVSGTLTQELD